MVLQGFDLIEYTIPDLVDFCERMEATKNANGNKMGGNDRTARKNQGKQETSKAARTQSKKRGKLDNSINGEFYCMVHGTNDSHMSDNCFTPKKMLKINKPDNGSKKAPISDKANALFEYVHKQRQNKNSNKDKQAAAR